MYQWNVHEINQNLIIEMVFSFLFLELRCINIIFEQTYAKMIVRYM